MLPANAATDPKEQKILYQAKTKTQPTTERYKPH